MSRIGKEPVTIPAGVTVEVKEKEFIVKGPLGTLVQDYDPAITITVDGGVATLTRANDLGPIRAKHGLYRALLFNMVTGVTKGFEKVLIVNGVGWKVAMQGNKLVMNVGYSHPVEMEAPAIIIYWDCKENYAKEIIRNNGYSNFGGTHPFRLFRHYFYRHLRRRWSNISRS